ncbi:MAG TPA: hypothetical protein VM243_07560 [Phycisphaerae bacterium]|nr:hypothetical protein [Phycisphaerae bacterium]
MCGPPDFAALETCVIRLAELSAAGLGTYAVCQTAAMCRGFASGRGKRQKKTSPHPPARPVAEGPNDHLDT